MSNAVLVFQKDQGWVVRLVEGAAESEREFDFENHARAWAEGQRIRLKLTPPADADMRRAGQAFHPVPPSP